MRNGLPNPVYWLLVVLFVVTTSAKIFRVLLYARDAMIGEEPLVAGRFGTAASLRLTASCFALMALTSGLRTLREDRPLRLPARTLLQVVFGFSGAMAVIHLLPSLG